MVVVFVWKILILYFKGKQDIINMFIIFLYTQSWANIKEKTMSIIIIIIASFERKE
jgi:hypothetical protein